MKLVLKYFGKVVQKSELEEGREYFLGRHESCDFVLEKVAGLSRKHVKIYQSEDNGNWVVENLSEGEGLYLEGEKVPAVELDGSCSLNLKNYVLEFVKESPPPLNQDKKSLQDESPKESNTQTKGVELNEGTRVLSDSHLVYSLYVYIEGEFSDHIRLSKGSEWTIGRSEDCDISVDYSILTRKHLQITKTDSRFFVKDLGSSNKTFLNKKELKPHKEVPLEPNDEISVADLKILFEIRDKNYKKMMSELVTIDENQSEEGEILPDIAPAKVVLEESPLTPEHINKKKSFLNPKRMILLALIGLLGAGLYLQKQSNTKKQEELAEQQKSQELENKLEVFYKEALLNLEEERYLLCIEQIEDLHKHSGTGHYKDSPQILIQCHNALESQKQKEAYLAQEKIKQETEKKVKKIVEKCKTDYADNKIQTEEELNQCAKELLSGLDPANPEISNIRMEITEKANIQLLEDQKKEAYKKTIQSKKALYNRAKKISLQNKPLKAVAAYNVFLKSARGMASLKSLSQQAEGERNSIQNNYDNQLNQLHESCEALIQANKMKEAFFDCKKVLGFKAEDKKAKQYIEQASLQLKKELKPLYEQSMMDESFSRIEEAKKLWQEIVDKDIPGNYYHLKASSQLKKYR